MHNGIPQPYVFGFLSLLGYFWHVTDMHHDPSYSGQGQRAESCPLSLKDELGDWGNYLCDSPWPLINSSIHAMKALYRNEDFIMWTGYVESNQVLV